MLSLLSLYFLLGFALVVDIKEHLASGADERLVIDLRININETLRSIFFLCEVSDTCIIDLCITRLPLFHHLHSLSHALSRFHCANVSLAPACIRNTKGKLHYQMTFCMHLGSEERVSSSIALVFTSHVSH